MKRLNDWWTTEQVGQMSKLIFQIIQNLFSLSYFESTLKHVRHDRRFRRWKLKAVGFVYHQDYIKMKVNSLTHRIYKIYLHIHGDFVKYAFWPTCQNLNKILLSLCRKNSCLLVSLIVGSENLLIELVYCVAVAFTVTELLIINISCRFSWQNINRVHHPNSYSLDLVSVQLGDFQR